MAKPQKLGEALVAFALDGRFPDDISTLPAVGGAELKPAIEALRKAKTELETEIHDINEDTKDDVSSWIKNANDVQQDIARSKIIANDIVRQAEAPDVSGQVIQDAEAKTDFLNRELQYSVQLHTALSSLRRVNELFGKVEQALREKRVLDSLHLLEESWAALDRVEVNKSCRVIKLLNVRSFELKNDIHDVFDQLWKELVHVDVVEHTVAIHKESSNGQMSLADAVTGLQAYKEVDERMEQLWHNIEAAIITPTTDSTAQERPGVLAEGDTLRLSGTAGSSVADVLSDLEVVLAFVAQRLPTELLESLWSLMMPDIVPNLIRDWLKPIVPPSLQDMDKFQENIDGILQFCGNLERHGVTGYGELSDWAKNAPKIWLEKYKERVLDTVRTGLQRGLGESREVEKVEKHMVSMAEGKEIATTGAGATAETNDWAAAWGDEWDDEDQSTAPEKETRADPESHGNEGEDDGADAWGWDEDDGQKAVEQKDNADENGVEDNDADEGADAWGWGDDDENLAEETATERQAPEGNPPRPAPKSATRPAVKRGETEAGEETRELVLKEVYHISSMPDPVFDLICTVLEDGAALTNEDTQYDLVAATAPGFFTLPTFAMALFRAVSPHYYSLGVGGNMFLYNDAMYLAERLTDLSTEWKQREDLSPRAKAMLRLDNDIKTLRSFANRSYAAEMNIQRTVLRDLLGGSQSILQQENDDAEATVESGMARIRTVAETWRAILARSVWSQAVGALAEALAAKLIVDVLETPSIGQDDAYRIASVISAATRLDDLFLPGGGGGDEAVATSEGPGGGEQVPTTAQYAPSWLRMQFLSEVLQSNLNEVKFLWLESELSLYFTVEEVVDLIEASFESSARSRAVIKEIRARPRPLEE